MAGSNLMSILGPSLATGALSSVANFATMAYQNKFNAQQAQIARDWNLEQDNTKYQRAVVDMQKAGVNPALMMSKGPISTQAATNISAQGATPAYMNMNAVASMAQSISQAKLNSAQERNLDTDSDLKRAQANYYNNLGDKITQEIIELKTNNKYLDEYNQLRNDGMKKANDLTDSQIKEIDSKINNLKEDTKLKIAQAKSEQEKANLYVTESMLNNVKATQIVALLPYQQNLMSAQSDYNRASAKYQLVQAAYQQGLINEGMIEAAVRQTNAYADKAQIDTTVQETLHALGFEKTQVNNTKSQTVRNYTGAVTDVINGIANAFNTVLSVALKVPPGAVTPAAFIAQ